MAKTNSQPLNFNRLHLVSGERGIGKTQVCAGLAQLLSLYGADLAGLISPPVFANGRKTAIDAYDLRSQQRRRLANLREPREVANGSMYAWAFDEVVLTWGNEILRRATPCGVLIVDELGPLEFLEGRGWTAGLAALGSRDYRMAVATIRPGLLRVAQQRWPGAQLHVLESGDDLQAVWTELSHAAAEG